MFIAVFAWDGQHIRYAEKQSLGEIRDFLFMTAS